MEKKHYAFAKVGDDSISLKELVNNIVHSSLPTAINNKSNVVNDVEQEVLLGEGNQKISAIVRDLLAMVVLNSKNGEIHITADRYSDVVTLEIQERNNYNGYALAFSIGSIEPDAFNIGGHIAIKGAQQKVVTISFSFPGKYAA